MTMCGSAEIWTGGCGCAPAGPPQMAVNAIANAAAFRIMTSTAINGEANLSHHCSLRKWPPDLPVGLRRTTPPLRLRY